MGRDTGLGHATASGLFCCEEDPGNVAPGSFCAFSTLNEPRTDENENDGIRPGPRARGRADTAQTHHVRSSTAHVLDGTEEEPT